MIDQKLVAWGRSGNIIREIAEYGAEQARIVGAENVYNFTMVRRALTRRHASLKKWTS